MHLQQLNLHKLINFQLNRYLIDFLKFIIMIKHHLELFFIFLHQMLIIQKLEELFIRLLVLSFKRKNLPSYLFKNFKNNLFREVYLISCKNIWQLSLISKCYLLVFLRQDISSKDFFIIILCL
jgi:hypothetical protein